jgi:excisionase family DNA binding protein
VEKYLSVTEYGQLHDLDSGYIRKMIAAGRIDAVKIGNRWAIPAGTPKPADRRVTTGKYKNWRKKPPSD